MIVFMANVSVAQAANRLGVSVSRIHQRIVDGSLRAQRIGSQWVVDERSLWEVSERRDAGRPLSARSAWALIAQSVKDRGVLSGLAPVEQSRAQQRLNRLFAYVDEGAATEGDVQRLAVTLRTLLRNRAERCLFRAAPADLDDLRNDPLWQAVVTSAASGIGSLDVEGYVSEAGAEVLARRYLLANFDRDANVVMHVVPPGHQAYADSKLQLAADLAEHRAPREEARAAALLVELARDRLDVRP